MDVIAIRDYIRAFNTGAAPRFAATLFSAGDALSDFPHRGRPTDLSGVRECVVRGTPYILAYRVIETEIQILRVWHGAQDRS
ncbi:type II toxin-antitoxin system RelE/ParE family toxin [Rhodospirillum sp. A1_3_36]|uniref:type II toxin-antitoxin system RelE/ParE family toxin n=1 Tax=Rhodospirillum sp. A1_3_36 TaxID=3391666 RepID=UPI0039A6451D